MFFGSSERLQRLRNTDKAPPRVVNRWPEIRRKIEADRIAAQEKARLSHELARYGATKARKQFEELARERRALRAALKGEPEAAIRDTESPKRSFHTVSSIARRVCLAFKITHSQLITKSREGVLVRARQMVAYWAIRLTNLSMTVVGKLMCLNHSTIIHNSRQWPVVRKVLYRRNLKAVA